ncbi:hydroxyacylglutathione hydrolase family protein [Candidatus Nitrosotenuis chungbukensis]|uniref:hydroxyacylglutathione hydrolase family protein n=1 Tax=Candidatus Nitrosotenuis chungbukensis TaxID=1353246 RepID=UPI0005B27E33|nr:hydroxyacylglutathione hydrolase family protein [Candidatus Nitrosotenuis chungbukensis]WKT58781.1 hydroxyacylglutathione hydrolase family protein [Candidatus Nitrosotenuis chungbukensis]
MIVHQLQVGNMQNFTYVLEDEDTSQAIILDPSWDLDEVNRIIEKNNLTIKYIVNTHHHFDHTLGNESMAKETGAKIIQHASSTLKHDISVSGGDKIKFGNSELEVIYTPGHSKDSMCLVGDGKIFSGDTLFVGTCGRVDLPGGDARELYHSLVDTLRKLDDNLLMYPGHNYGTTPTSTIGEQKRMNLVMQPRTEQEFLEMMGIG